MNQDRMVKRTQFLETRLFDAGDKRGELSSALIFMDIAQVSSDAAGVVGGGDGASRQVPFEGQDKALLALIAHSLQLVERGGML
ncbi:hypothetical protein AYI68_g1590 [Smittium mucronatum]|uniref:Uncharacterized protein n=1 Tax=Smittium mucronatum TaxID=133383 RepID=A0A1R0H510_9FUNG|nr:hypothetical protein AYI68_g1590 [Smittium mucronatum]